MQVVEVLSGDEVVGVILGVALLSVRVQLLIQMVPVLLAAGQMQVVAGKDCKQGNTSHVGFAVSTDWLHLVKGLAWAGCGRSADALYSHLPCSSSSNSSPKVSVAWSSQAHQRLRRSS